MAVHPAFGRAGLGAMLTVECERRAADLGYTKAIHALMHDNATSRSVSDRWAHTIRRYALFVREIGRMNLATILEERALTARDVPAIIDVIGGALASRPSGAWTPPAGEPPMSCSVPGLGPGDAVLVLQPMSVEFYAVLLGAFRAGLVAVLVIQVRGCESWTGAAPCCQSRGLWAVPRPTR